MRIGNGEYYKLFQSRWSVWVWNIFIYLSGYITDSSSNFLLLLFTCWKDLVYSLTKVVLFYMSFLKIFLFCSGVSVINICLSHELLHVRQHGKVWWMNTSIFVFIWDTKEFFSVWDCHLLISCWVLFEWGAIDWSLGKYILYIDRNWLAALMLPWYLLTTTYFLEIWCSMMRRVCTIIA